MRGFHLGKLVLSPVGPRPRFLGRELRRGERLLHLLGLLLLNCDLLGFLGRVGLQLADSVLVLDRQDLVLPSQLFLVEQKMSTLQPIGI